VRFATNDQMLEILGYTRKRVIGVDETPIVEWSTVIIVWPCGGRSGRVEVDPLAFAAVEILDVGK
jgi:hypothetical protein